MSKEEIEKVRFLVDNSIQNYGFNDPDELNQKLIIDKELMPERLISWSLEVKNEDFGLLRGAPISSILPPTPRKRDELERPIDFEDMVCCQVLSLFGRLFQYVGKVDPNVVQNVFYVPGHEELQLGSGTQKLEWHVEDGLHAFRPDWVGLLCVREGEDTQTYLARTRDLPNNDTTIEMCNRAFQLRVDDSFSEEFRSKIVETCTLRPQSFGFEVVFDPDFTISRNALEDEKLQEFSKAFDAIANSITLRTGDMLVFNNRRTVHGRSKYIPLSIGHDRWLKRGLCLSDSVYEAQSRCGRVPFTLI